MQKITIELKKRVHDDIIPNQQVTMLGARVTVGEATYTTWQGDVVELKKEIGRIVSPHLSAWAET